MNSSNDAKQDEQKTELPWLLIKPKITGAGTVYRKDGTVSTPTEPKEKEHGSNTDSNGA